MRDRAYGVYRKLLAEGKSTAPLALEEVERIDRERAVHGRRVREAEALVDEWSGPPDLDRALDVCNGLVDLVQGRIRKAEGTRELNEALSIVVAGMWAEVEGDRERLLVEFELVERVEHVLPRRPADHVRPTADAAAAQLGRPDGPGAPASIWDSHLGQPTI